MLVPTPREESLRDLDERCMSTHTAYGTRLGYPTHILRQDVVGKGEMIDLMFSKPLYMLSLAVAEMAKPASERAEWLVFFDSDTVLLNPNVPWAAFLPPEDFKDIHFVAIKDWNGFNAGAFFVRVNEWNVRMLSQASTSHEPPPDEEQGPDREQSCFKSVAKRPGYREHVVYEPVEWYNAFEESGGQSPKFEPGEMMVHFSGMKTEKYARMKE